MQVYPTEATVPELAHAFPFKVRALHQIELSSRCDLRCVYCPSPQIMAGKFPNRPPVDMSLNHFAGAIEHVAYYVTRGTQHEVNLAGIGESTLHPQLDQFLAHARERLPHLPFVMATNGLNIAKDEAIANTLAKYSVRCWVSLHRPEKAALAVERLRERNILLGVSVDPAMNADDWAGQVKWFRSQPYVSPCQWLREGKAMVMAHGAITTCCLDASGKGVIGHVHDEPGTLATKPYSLCRTCQQVVRVRDYDQRG